MTIEAIERRLADADKNGTATDVAFWVGYLEATRAAIEKLKTHPDNQPNEPLTAEELRGMVGEWVWVTVHYNHCDCSGWALICTGATLGYLDQMLSIKDCGTKFDAHRRPPEGA